MYGRKLFSRHLLVIVAVVQCFFSIPCRSAGAKSLMFQSENSEVAVEHLRCEYMVNPIGIDVSRPRLSWTIQSTHRGVVQTAYQVQVAAAVEKLGSEDLSWDSARVESDRSIHVVYGGEELESGVRYYWRARIWDGSGRPSKWSSPAFWEMGLLARSDWQTDWIEPDIEEDVTVPQPASMLRRRFEIGAPVRSARLYITSHGLYEVYLNGQIVDDRIFEPGWTSYRKRLQYQTYDVSNLLRQGANAMGVLLGDGWYRGYIGFRNQRNYYGKKLGVLLHLKISYSDGRTEVVGSDEFWKASTGPILVSDIYMGEVYDARLEQPGWSLPEFDDSSWAGVRVKAVEPAKLIASMGPPVRRIEEIRPISISETAEGSVLVDMGQNLVGRVRLRVAGPRGTEVRLKHAEVLDKAGHLYTENLRAARQEVVYTLKGEKTEIYEPHFTFQGFRYVEVFGFPGALTLDSVTGIVIHSDMAVTGSFETDNPLINQLQHNILWGQKGNFLDVPTDCPQRDERLGWTGDAQVFAETAAFNMDVAAFFTKWLGDLEADQQDDGKIPHVVPDVLGGAGSAGWADAGVIIPWTLYQRYGDTKVLEQQYESMKRWVDYIAGQAGDRFLWNKGSHFGDWLAYNTTRSDYPGATTDKDFIAQAFFAYSTSLLLKTARVLGRERDAQKYSRLLQQVQQAFLDEYVTPNWRLSPNTQTAYTLALMFDLVPVEGRQLAVQRLVSDIRQFENHLTTGFLGTPYLCPVLTRNDRTSVAYDLLLQETYPSWLYPVKQGATTIWERWDGIKPDGSFQNPGMNSFNHYAYGAIGAWLYSTVAGIQIDPRSPGFKHLLLKPEPGGGLTRASGRLRSMYGDIQSSWSLEEERMRYEVTVPANTRATIYFPLARSNQIREGTTPLSDVEGVSRTYQDGDDTVAEIGSGRYLFTYSSPALRERAPVE